MCPGKQFADIEIFLAIAMSLSVFDIKKPVKNGKEMDVRYSFSANGLLRWVALSEPKMERLWYDLL